MVRRIVRKIKRKTPSETVNPTPEPVLPVEPAVSRPVYYGGFVATLFIIIVIAIFVLDVSQSLNKGFFSKKYYLLKKVSQFTGTETIGIKINARDVVAVDNNLMAVLDTGGRVLLCDFNGKLIRQWGKNDHGSKGGKNKALTDENYEFHEPSAITTDRKGHVYVLETWTGLIKGYDLNGKYIGTLNWGKTQCCYGPRRLAWGGDCFVICDSARYRIARVSLDEQNLAIWGGKGKKKGEFDCLNNVFVDEKGNTYACDGGENKRVQVFNSSGKVTQVFKTDVDTQDLVLDTQGRIFIGGFTDSSKVFNANGDFLGFMAEESQPTTPISGIEGMDISPGNLIITSCGDIVTVYRVSDKKKK